MILHTRALKVVHFRALCSRRHGPELSVKKVEKRQDSNDYGMSGREPIFQGTVFEAESIPPQLTIAVRTHYKEPALLRICHTNICEHAMRSWQTRTGAKCVLSLLEVLFFADVPRTYIWRTSRMTQIDWGWQNWPAAVTGEPAHWYVGWSISSLTVFLDWKTLSKFYQMCPAGNEAMCKVFLNCETMCDVLKLWAPYCMNIYAKYFNFSVFASLGNFRRQVLNSK